MEITVYCMGGLCLEEDNVDGREAQDLKRIILRSFDTHTGYTVITCGI